MKERLKFNHHESKLFMPNEIFEDLQEHISTTPHISFSYSYVYLCNWLYRYTKHFNVDVFTNSKIKEMLGYRSDNKSINYLIKKNGLLDEIGYLESTRDYPMLWEYADDHLTFELRSEYQDVASHLPTIPRRFFLKYPTTAFLRRERDVEGEHYTEGTFYDISNTHCIPFEVFMFCMSNKDVGCNGFYLYSYLKHKNDIFKDGYDVSLPRLSSETGMPETTLNRVMNSLKSYRMIDFTHNQEFFVAGLSASERKPNTYITRNHEDFSNEKVDYKKMRSMTRDEYESKRKLSSTLRQIVDENVPF